MKDTLSPPAAVSAARAAHPLLDPRLPSRDPALARLWIATYRKALREPEAWSRMLSAYAGPAGGEAPPGEDMAPYFREVDLYLDDLLRLVPEALQRHLEPLARTRRLNDMLSLFRAVFEGPSPRIRYEAQRKLFLSKIFFDVEHCRSIRDGPRHQQRFESLLSEAIWDGADAGGDVEICCRLERSASGDDRLEVGVPRDEATRCWRFQMRRLPPAEGEAEVDVFHYRSRFKKESILAPPTLDAGGFLLLAEEPRWPSLGGRSASIVSKMVRRGLADPGMVQDVLGAMFIVGDRRQAYALERRLVAALGGPLRFRDRVDTLRGERDRAKLDHRSSSGFRVLKSIVDILVEDPSARVPYLFAVEIQVFPLEAYLKTLLDESFASHTAYKRRQFLRDLIPALFPPEIFGEETRLLGATT